MAFLSKTTILLSLLSPTHARTHTLPVSYVGGRKWVILRTKTKLPYTRRRATVRRRRAPSAYEKSEIRIPRVAIVVNERRRSRFLRKKNIMSICASMRDRSAAYLLLPNKDSSDFENSVFPRKDPLTFITVSLFRDNIYSRGIKQLARICILC